MQSLVAGSSLENAAGSGRLDIVTTGKFGGPVWFENKGTIGDTVSGK